MAYIRFGWWVNVYGGIVCCCTPPQHNDELHHFDIIVARRGTISFRQSCHRFCCIRCCYCCFTCFTCSCNSPKPNRYQKGAKDSHAICQQHHSKHIRKWNIKHMMFVWTLYVTSDPLNFFSLSIYNCNLNIRQFSERCNSISPTIQTFRFNIHATRA